jgi:hypothetical protein
MAMALGGVFLPHEVQHIAVKTTSATTGKLDFSDGKDTNQT